jgi:hypothetical protein
MFYKKMPFDFDPYTRNRNDIFKELIENLNK